MFNIISKKFQHNDDFFNFNPEAARAQTHFDPIRTEAAPSFVLVSRSEQTRTIRQIEPHEMRISSRTKEPK